MGYADRMGVTKPGCWGTRAFNPSDVECESCRYQHSCRQNQDEYRVPISVNRPSSSYSPSPSRDDREMESSWKPGLVKEGERPVDRFFKDALSGALRGGFYEMYSFWKHYRIR